jgi:hypothetical protein
MAIPLRTLSSIAEEIAADLAMSGRSASRDLLDSMSDYHGFWKKSLPPDYVARFSSASRLDLRDIQADIVRVTTDLTAEVHFHAKASAFVVCLGHREGFPDPSKAKTFAAGSWKPLVGGERLEIPAGEPHGFTVDSGGVLYFLSVQSPPVNRAGHEDDYHRVSGTPFRT